MFEWANPQGAAFFSAEQMEEQGRLIPDTTNPLFLLAASLVNETGRNIFLTGKAGTGKTTFLKYIREHCPKHMAIVAPTGVAAINAGGVTIHSFFQVPPGVFLPVPQMAPESSATQEIHSRQSLLAKLRYTREKRKLFQQLELLVIDEISMVRADLLDAIDTILRAVRRKPHEPFGGVQLLFIGDLYQLPPVVKDNDWSHLSAHYNSPFFFDSRVLQERLPLYIEFEKIYRQRDAAFVALLNQVRNNALDEEAERLLESRFQPGFSPQNSKGYIILTSHNEQARTTNSRYLQQLPGATVSYSALIDGNFPDNAFPADAELQLKPGAQVMFIRNDSAEKGKRFFNGKMGVVKDLEDDLITVQYEPGEEIRVEREKWKNIRYTVNVDSDKLEEDELGSFSQFPLRLAWAITIHKSQGLTFDKAIIDAGEAFAPGQVYVALSRCSSLEGLVLKSRLKNRALLTDPRVSSFAGQLAGSVALKEELEQARQQYQERLMRDLFDFESPGVSAHELCQYVETHHSSFTGDPKNWIRICAEEIRLIRETGSRFRQWLDERFSLNNDWSYSREVPDRALKAAGFFTEKISMQLEAIVQCPLRTDSWQHAREFNEMARDLFSQLHSKQYLLKGFDGIIQAVNWHEKKLGFRLPSFSLDIYSLSANNRYTGTHPELFRQLKAVRDSLCLRSGLPVYMVAGSQALEEMTRRRPQTPEQLLQIPGFGKKKLELYGRHFLDVITGYCNGAGIEPEPGDFTDNSGKKEKRKRAKQTGETYRETLRLYREGKDIQAIARERKLHEGTIQSHLCRFIASGDIKTEALVDPAHLKLILKALQKNKGAGIGQLKQQLPVNISYDEIRMVIAGMRQPGKPSTDQ